MRFIVIEICGEGTVKDWLRSTPSRRATSKVRVSFRTCRSRLSRMNDATTEWEIGLSAWIIQDENYGDFATGERAEFALEFYPENCRLVDAREKSCTKIAAAKYAIVGEVVHLCDEVW